jgi:hypothetical protein
MLHNPGWDVKLVITNNSEEDSCNIPPRRQTIPILKISETGNCFIVPPGANFQTLLLQRRWELESENRHTTKAETFWVFKYCRMFGLSTGSYISVSWVLNPEDGHIMILKTPVTSGLRNNVPGDWELEHTVRTSNLAKNIFCYRPRTWEQCCTFQDSRCQRWSCRRLQPGRWKLRRQCRCLLLLLHRHWQLQTYRGLWR